MPRMPVDSSIGLCLYCPNLCLSRCPVSLSTGNLTLSAWGKMSCAWRLRSQLVTETRASRHPTFMCLDCLACREACDHGQDVPSALAEVRFGFRTAPAEPHAREPDPSGLPLPALVPYDPEEAWRILRDATPAWRRSEDCQALLVPGMELLDASLAPVLAAIFRVLDLVGDRETGVNRDSVLECGHRPHACGDLSAAIEEARRAASRFSRYSRILLASPHCASFALGRWPTLDLGRSPRMLTLLEHVGRNADLLRPGSFDGKVAWHDPCHLGRHLGQYGLPRDLLQWATNARPVELPYSHNRSYCCGGGYPLSAASPTVSLSIASLLASHVREAAADVLAVGCGNCLKNLRLAAPDLNVVHIMEILARRGT